MTVNETGEYSRADDGPGYVLITPLRNERGVIDQMIGTVTSQTLRPRCWVIAVDDRSDDGSYEYAQQALEGISWAKVVKGRSDPSEGYSHKNFARMVNAALEGAIASGVEAEFIGKTDAEVRLDPEYFESLMNEMVKDRRIVISCGVQRFEIEGVSYTINNGSSDPLVGFNDIRLYRREFLLGMGGYPISFQPDTVLLIKALNRGHHTQVFPKVSFVKRRQGASKIGLWRGSVLRGRGLYAMGYTPLYAFLYSLYYSKFPPHYQWLPMTYGYIRGSVQRSDKVDDREILDYFAQRHLWKTISSVIRG